MNKRISRGACTVLSVLALVATACGQGGGAKGDGNGKGSDTVTVALSTFSSEAVDPSTDQTAGLNYSGPMFDWLIGASADGKLSSDYGVLESWTPNADASQWTLTLHKGVKWQDGTAMTADDVKFTLEHYTREGAVCSTCVGLRAELKSVEKVDDLTVRVLLTRADVALPNALGPLEGDLKVLPKAYYESKGAQGFSTEPMGSGPWKFVERKLGESIRYERNSQYWDTDRIPKFAKLEIVLVPDSSARAAMLKRGDADLVVLDPSDVRGIKQAGFKIRSVNTVALTALMFFRSWDPEFLTNKLEFRKALALSVDWGAIAKSYYPPEVGAPYSGGAVPFTPASMGADPSLGSYPYQPDEAKTLLAQAGYHGEEIPLWSYSFNVNPEQPEVNEVIAGYWRKIGIKVKIIPIEWSVFRLRQLKDPPDYAPPAAIGVQGPSTRPSVLTNMRTFMVSHEAGGAIWGYWNPTRIDAEYKRIGAIVDSTKRDQELRTLNRSLYQEYWALPIAIKNLPFGSSSRIGGWTPTTASPNDLVYESLTPAS